MKKLLLTASIFLMGLSAHGMDWQTEQNLETAKEAALRNFSVMAYPNDDFDYSISVRAIENAINKFPDFLNWKFEGNRTILHLMAINGRSEEALEYLLGFTPDLTNIQDDNGNIPEAYGATKPATMEIFNRFKQNPWRNANANPDIQDNPNGPLVINANPGIQNNASGLQDESKPQIPGQTSIFSKKVLGVLGTMVLLGLLYRYNKSRKQSATA